MRTLLSHAFVKRRRAKIAAFVSVAVGLVPYGAPAEMHAWFAEQFPWAPGWSHIALVVAVLTWRIGAGAQEVRKSTRSRA